MKAVLRWIALAGAWVIPIVAAGQSSSDKAAAQALYNEGKQLLDEKRYEPACAKLAESNRLDPGIGTMLHLASCWEKLGKTASAWGQFREAEQVARKEGDKRVDVAKKYADALEPRLSRLTIYVPQTSEVQGLDVKRDGVAVGKGQWGTPVPVDPGSHVVTASAPWKKAWESKVDVPTEKGLATVTVPVLVDEPREVPTAAPTATAPRDPVAPAATTSGPGAPPGGELPPSRNVQRVAGLALMGVGVVGLGIGSYFGIRAKSQYDDSGCDGNVCKDDASAQRVREAKSSGNVSTILFVVGGVLGVGGVVLFATAPSKDAPRVSIGPGSVTLGGSF